MDIFAKIPKNTNVRLLAQCRAAGASPYFHTLYSQQDTIVNMEGRRTIMLGSNNYLGLTNHPEVKAAGMEAIERYGSGCSGSRFLNGTLELHVQLEEEIAAGLASGEPKSALAKRLAKSFSLPRAEVYDKVVAAAR